MKPDIRFTWNDGFAIAYQVVGRGRQDLVYLPGYVQNVDLQWDIPIYARFLERLSSFSRLILLDTRGLGCSDRFPPDRAPALEETTDDVLAVMEAVGSRDATVFSVQEGCFPALLLAATYPDRVSRLVLFHGSPSWMRSDDLQDEWSPTELESHLRSARRATSAVERIDSYIRNAAPSLLGDGTTARALATMKFNTQGIGASIEDTRRIAAIDLRHLLPTIGAPTMVLERPDALDSSSGRYLADHITGADYVELAGLDSLPWIGDQEPVLEATERFMGVEPWTPISDRHLSTVLFTDIVGSTAEATAIGDAKWARLLADHHHIVRQHLVAHGGAEVDTAGDGFFATFDGPAQAVRCAVATERAVAELGLTIRSGVHTGEVETVAGKPGGMAVIVGARILGAAGGGDVLVSQTVKDLVAGSGLSFEDTGEHELKGVPARWRLYRVVG